MIKISPRFYEKLYGLRYILPVLITLIVVACCVLSIVQVQHRVLSALQSAKPQASASDAQATEMEAAATSLPVIMLTETPQPEAGTVTVEITPTALPNTVTPTVFTMIESTATPAEVLGQTDETPTAMVNTPTPTESVTALSSDTTELLVVQRGESLWKIAARLCASGMDWKLIFAANRDRIRNPNIIYINQQLVIPCIQSKPSD
jgi:nucleoid-associated protein YgaU